jgi:hypothetical protein
VADEILAIGPCVACENPFSFNPDNVPIVSIDPATGMPPDVDPVTWEPLPQPRKVAETARMPICPTCVAAVNAVRKAQGLSVAWPSSGGATT